MPQDWEVLRQRVHDFAIERDWERFHTPKNLAMALAGEVGELVSELQWQTDQQIAEDLESGGLRSRLKDEAADVLIYVLRLADVCGFDLLGAAEEKIELNSRRYPVHLAKGNARKYDELQGD